MAVDQEKRCHVLKDDRAHHRAACAHYTGVPLHTHQPDFVAAPANHLGWSVSRMVASRISFALIKPVPPERCRRSTVLRRHPEWSSSRDLDEVWI